jgi:hypothetical protein
MAIYTRFDAGAFGAARASAGTPTKICEGKPDDAAIYAISFRAKVTNVGNIWIGGGEEEDRSVLLAVAEMDGLAPGQVLALEFDKWINASHIYFCTENNNDGLDFYGVTA